MVRVLAAMLAIGVVAGAARAQPADEAWAEYDAAFAQAASGDVAGATARLAEVARRWPDHPAAARALALVRAPEPRRDNPRVARGELVFWSTVGGVSIAANACVALDCTSARSYAAVYMGAVGGALGVSVLASRNGVNQGEAQLYNSAQTWGAWTGLAINDGFAETRAEAGTAIAAQLGGLGAGLALWQVWHPTQGDVALTNSFFLWGTVLTVWGHLAVDAEPQLRTIVLAGDASILAGALVSREVKMSRGRTLLIDVGGLLGTLAGSLVAVGTDSSQGAGIGLLAGTAGGLAIAAVATKDWDAPPVQLAPTVMTGPGHSTAWGIGAGGTF